MCIQPVINCLAATSPATLSCSMVLSIVSNLFCYLFCCLCRHPNSKMSSYLSLHSEITLLTNNESKSSAQSFCLTHNCIKTGHPWSSLHSIIQNSTLYVLVLHLLSHVIVLLSLLVSTFQTDHSITSFLSYGMVLLLTYFMPLITPLLLQLLLALASLTSPPLTF